MNPRTLLEKLWQRHVVREDAAGSALLYIDRLLVYEVTSTQAFEGMRLSGRRPWRKQSVLATCDHNVPTTSRARGLSDPLARLQVETLSRNCADFEITEFGINDSRQGIVHVIGPEQGATLPGMTVVCGDSHTSAHGAFAPATAAAAAVAGFRLRIDLPSQTITTRKACACISRSMHSVRIV